MKRFNIKAFRGYSCHPNNNDETDVYNVPHCVTVEESVKTQQQVRAMYSFKYVSFQIFTHSAFVDVFQSHFVLYKLSSN
jgi:hypothetical protein